MWTYGSIALFFYKVVKNVDETIHLVKRMKEGDELAFVRLYELYYNQSYYFALKITRNEADAKDAIQLAFMQVRQSIHQLNHPRYFKRWFYQIILTKCKNIFRDNKFKTADISLIENDYDFSEQRSYMIPEKSVAIKCEREILLHFIDQLSPEKKVVVMLICFEQMKMRDIAIILNVPIGTVKSRFSVAKKELKEAILKYEKNEHIKLHFDTISMTSIITGVLLSEYQTSITLVGVFSTTGWYQKLYSKLSQNFVTIVSASTVATLVVAGGIMTQTDNMRAENTENMQTVKTNIPKRLSAKEALNVSESKDAMFPSISYRDKSINNPRAAYIALLNWAHCEIEMEGKNSDDIAEIIPIYESLKKENGRYWKEMVNSKWSESFEQKINE